MQNKNWRIYLGIFLLALGSIALLQSLGIISFASNLLSLGVGIAFCVGGAFFLYMLLTNHQENWWASFPGVILFTLGLTIGISTVFPRLADYIAGPFFLAGLSLSFWMVFLITPHNWWAIIPGGVMLTLSLIALLSGFEATSGLETGGILFLGLAGTFALVALLPRSEHKMSWPWIPAGILGLMGLLLQLSAANLINFIWPVALILVGVFMVIRTLIRK